MTHQTAHFLEMSDILGFKVECKQCHASVFLSKEANVRLDRFRHCPNCNEPWFQLPEGSTIEKSVKDFVDAFQHFEALLGRVEKVSGDGRFAFSLQIKEPKEK